ncbi:MAG: AEC family transporter [Proteobacteria bacterium]|nr:AEC family transporter [Desulfobulbaceae bacterium]MBU4154287.1 AEC family transporter [Pseudomonadota bacterium]MDP2104359.1 AEC family transporter [Desulfobulbaceae bacterium]
MENFVAIITYLLIGMVFRHLPDFPAETGKVLNSFVIYVSLPALVLLKIPDLDFSQNVMVPAVMPWVMLICSVSFILVLARVLTWERPTTGCLLLMVPLGNTSFLGIPMVKAFWGEQAIPYAVLYDQLGSFLALATYGSVVLALFGSERCRPTWGGVVKRILSFPPFLALTLALLLRSVAYPAMVSAVLSAMAATLVPVVMVAVGFQLTLRLNRAMISQLSIGLTLKLIVAPLVAFLLCTAVGLKGEAVQVAVFEAGMPPMVSAGALAIMANLSPVLTAALVGIGIVASFITLPILHALLS